MSCWQHRRRGAEISWLATAWRTENLPLPSALINMIYDEFTEVEAEEQEADFDPAWMATADYDEFGFETSAEPEPLPTEPHLPHVPMREQFPPAGSDYMGGSSDGWEYRSTFAGSKLAYTYDMVRQFLREEGYGDVPLPATADELRLFKRPRQAQLQLFGERGYIHNPIKILFPRPPAVRNALIVCIYNEQAKGHLLRFHGVVV